MLATDLFFTPVKEIMNSNEIDDELLNQLLDPFIRFDAMAGLGISVIDYYKRGFAYVSPFSMPLTGYKPEEVVSLGFDFPVKVIPCDDLRMLQEINEKGFQFFYNLPVERRSKCSISFDLRLNHVNGRTIMINHHVMPFLLTAHNEIWLAISMTSLSEHKESGNVSIRMLDEPSRFDYSFSRHKFIPSEPVVLSERGKQVFDLIVQNCPNVEIASRLDISNNTVKFHKKNIYSKTGIKNSMEAIRYAMVNQMPFY